MTNRISVSDIGDPRLTIFRLRDRQLAASQPRADAPHGLFVAEGDLVVERALDLGYEPYAALADQAKHIPILDRLPTATPIFLAPEPDTVRITELSVTLGVLALFHRRPQPAWQTVASSARFLIGLEAVVNPSNMGAIVRTATALGVDGLLIDHTSTDPFARRSVRTSMGATLHLPVGRVDGGADDWFAALDSLRTQGFRILGLTPAIDATPIDDLTLDDDEPRLLMLGSERAGLSAAALGLCEPVVIPMVPGNDSLNVAAACAIACHILRPNV